MKFAVLLVAISFTTSAQAIDVLEVNGQTQTPCTSPYLPAPMPCAFMAAMLTKMFGGGCGSSTCPVRL